MGFSENFPHAAIMSALGDDVVYRQRYGGGTYSVQAIVEMDVYIDDYHAETRNEIEFLKSSIGWEIVRGDYIIYRDKTYVLDSKIGQDADYERWGLIDG